MNSTQRICLDCYLQFKQICEKYNLRYYGIGGTCIGAVRHKGFIPWDDDMDIAMPYEDFSKLLSIVENEVKSDFEIRWPMESKKTCNNVLGIHRKNTAFIMKKDILFPMNYRGIGIDVMPIYGMSKNRIKQLIEARENDFYIRMDAKMKSAFNQYSTLHSKITWIIGRPFLSMNDPHFWIKRSIRRFSGTGFNNSDRIMFAWRRFAYPTTNYKSVFDYIDFESYNEMPFENTTMRVPVGYGNYLKRDFGDYMTLPPVEKRFSNHDLVVLDTEHSYKDYIGKI